jgi:plasmid replication initiation protein
MGLSESKSYSAFKDLNKHVLKPAIAEVNQVSNIIIEMEYKRTGRAISGVRFLVRSNPQLSFDGMQDENEIDKMAIFKRFLKIHDNKTLARKMIAEFGAEQIAKNLDYVEAQIAQGKVRSGPAFLKSSIQNNFLSEDARTSERRKVVEDKAQQMRLMEDAKNKREAKAKEVDRAYSTACIEAMKRAFEKLDHDEQRVVKAEFLAASDFGSFQVTDFRKNSWASRMVLAQAIKFWMGRKAPLPLMTDISKKFGIEDFEIYKAETTKIGVNLQKA